MIFDGVAVGRQPASSSLFRFPSTTSLSVNNFAIEVHGEWQVTEARYLSEASIMT